MAAIPNDDSGAAQSSVSVVLLSPVSKTSTGEFEWLLDVPRQLNNKTIMSICSHLSLAQSW